MARRMRWTRREGGMPGVAGGRWSPARGGAGGTAAFGVREEAAAAAVGTVSLEITGAVEPVGALRSFRWRRVGDRLGWWVGWGGVGWVGLGWTALALGWPPALVSFRLAPE